MTTPPNAAAPTRAVLALLVLVALAAGLWSAAPAAAVAGARTGIGTMETPGSGDADALAAPAGRQQSRRRVVRARRLPLLRTAVALAVRRPFRAHEPDTWLLRPARWPTGPGRAPPATA